MLEERVSQLFDDRIEAINGLPKSDPVDTFRAFVTADSRRGFAGLSRESGSRSIE